MKKLLSILLCIAFMASLTPVVFAAETGFMNVMSDKVWTFSEMTEVDGVYGSTGNASELSPVELAPDKGLNGAGDTALSITRGTDNKNVNISFVKYTPIEVRASEFKVKFNFNVNVTATKIKFVFRDETLGDYNALECVNGKVYFLGQELTTYKKETWYDVEMLFNIPLGYGQLKIKENSLNDFETYYVISNYVEYNTDNTIKNKGLFYGKTETVRLGMGLETNPGVVYIDNYYQNYADVDTDILASDDFSNGYTNIWAKTNIDGKAFVTLGEHTINGNKVLRIASNEGETKGDANSNVAQKIPTKTISKASLDTNYHFSYKFGGDTPNAIGGSLQTANGTGNKEIFIAKILNHKMVFFSGLTDATDGVVSLTGFGDIDEDTLYDVEAVYNPKNSKLTAVITNGEGKQFIATYGGSTISGLPTRFAIRNHSTDETGKSIVYFDDFKADILDTNGPKLKEALILSGYEQNASLDETIIFTYDRTINQAALTDAVVKLNDEVLSSDDYTITSDGKKVLVTLKDLDKGASYTLTLENVKDIISNASEDVGEFSFKTSSTDIKVDSLSLNEDGKLSAKVTSYYAEGKEIRFIVVIYDSEETMIKHAQAIPVLADNRNGEVIEEDFSSVLANKEDGDKVKAFVWSDFDTMVPFVKSYK